MDYLLSAEGILSLLMLTFMEIVLGIDNILFISIVSNRLPAKQEFKARNIGLALAMILRILLLFGISFILQMQQTMFTIENSYLQGNFSGQSLILLLGGLFLLYKSSTEIHHKIDGVSEKTESKSSPKLFKIIFQICLLNIVFSFDSILTAIGLTKSFLIMIIAIVVSVLVMMLFAGSVSRLIRRHPSIQILGLSFLILIGFLLMAEGFHNAHFSIMGFEVGAIPKGYLYFAIFFSIGVEFLNIKLRKKTKPITLQHPNLEEVIQKF